MVVFFYFAESVPLLSGCLAEGTVGQYACYYTCQLFARVWKGKNTRNGNGAGGGGVEVDTLFAPF